MVSAGATTRLVITSPAPAVTAGVTAGTIVVERRDQYGNVNIAETGLVVNLSSNSAGVNNFRDIADTNNITSVTINQGSGSVGFRYRDDKAGEVTISVTAGLWRERRSW